MISDEDENLARETILIAEDQELETQVAAEAAGETSQEVQENAGTQLKLDLAVQLDEEEIQSCIEALLFISDKPLSTTRLRDLLGPGFDLSLFQAALDSLVGRYQAGPSRY